MDKNGVAVRRWEALGFGFFEIGTVTALAQTGNPRPRLFRLPNERAIINRMGFNNKGAAAVADRLRGALHTIPMGINIGKSKVIALADSAADYAKSFEALAPFADYVVVNVSSPNTPGLRELQEKERLSEILQCLRSEREPVPILIKVSPDLDASGLDDVIEASVEGKAAGLIATNTSVTRPASGNFEEGGLSGAPLAKLADDCLAYLAKNVPSHFCLIGVGGIFNGSDIRRKLDLGAKLTQVYTGWVYRGPWSAPKMLLEFLAHKEIG